MPLPAVLPQEQAALPAIEHSWHVDLLKFVQDGLPKIFVTLLIAFVAQRLVLFFTNRLRRRADALVGNGRRSAQLRTVASILRASLYALLGAYVVIQTLGAIGVPLGPFIASAGVIGLGISFGAQSLFKDILNGMFILIEDQFSVGDAIRIAGLQGAVEDLTLRCTKLRDFDGTLYIIPNSQIVTVANLSRDFSVARLDVSVSADEDPDRVLLVLQQLASEIRADEAFRDVVLADPEILGVDRITGREITYPIIVRVRANQRDGVLRALRRHVLITFEREGIDLGTATTTVLLEQGPPAELPHPSFQPAP